MSVRSSLQCHLIVLALLAGAGGSLRAQMPDGSAQIRRVRTSPERLSGPRVGVTWFQGKAADSLDARLGIGPVISQFGWQFEHRLFAVEGGASGISEIIALVGGLENGEVLPSLSWLVGVRTFGGFELGAGPNVSGAGLAFVVGTGVNVQSGGLNIPLNLAIASSKYGVRATMLMGYNTRNSGL